MAADAQDEVRILKIRNNLFRQRLHEFERMASAAVSSDATSCVGKLATTTSISFDKNDGSHTICENKSCWAAGSGGVIKHNSLLILDGAF